MKEKKCLSLGENDAIIIRPLFESIENNFTIEFWVKPMGNITLPPEASNGVYGTQGQQYIIAPGYGGLQNRAGVGISVGNNGLCIFEHTENYLPALLVYETLLLGWVHVAVVYKDKQPLLYINGQYKKSGLVSSRSSVSPSGIFGLLDPYGSFLGKVADIRLWNCAREKEQVKAMMDEELSGLEDGLAGYWKIANLEERTLYDCSESHYHGFISGSGWRVSTESSQDFLLTISHYNHLGSVGGTERYIFEHERYLADTGIDTIHLFPFRRNIGVSYGGRYINNYKPEFIFEVIEREITVREAFIHHLLYWPAYLYWLLIDQLNDRNIKMTFFVHDFFFCCPSINLMYQNNQARRPCALASEKSGGKEICTGCDWSVTINSWRNSFSYLLDKGHRIIVPSQFVYEVFTNVYPNLKAKTIIQPHLLLSKTKQISPNGTNHRKIRLAFLGMTSQIKGQETWHHVISNYKLHQLYDFYHIGCGNRFGSVRSHPYNFWEGGVMAATNALLLNEIDLVLLWSVVPESFSYTFHEALAAGIPVLTSSITGNVADQVQKNSHLGRVFINEEDLFRFLLDTEQVLKFLNLQRYQYTLEFNPLSIENTKLL